MLRPTTRGLAAVGAFGLVVLSAVVTGTPELTPLAVAIGIPLVAGPVIATVRARRSIGIVEFHAHVEPAAVDVGSRMQVKLALTNRSSGTALAPLGLAPVDHRWRARGAGPGGVSPHRWVAPPVATMFLLPRPAPGTTGSCLLEVPTRRRGVLELPPQRTWTHDPIGLFGASGPETPTVLAVIHPVPVRPDHMVGAIPATVAGAAPAGATRPGSGMGELDGIRPYVAGDRLSLLHWPAKARYGTWFVRQFDAEGTSARSVVLDDRAGVHRQVEFERLISAALWVVLELLHEHQPVRLSTITGRTYSFEPDESGRADARLALAELRPSTQRSTVGLRTVATDAVVLTTRTGAERLFRPVAGPAAPADRDGRVDPGIDPSRVVVV
jgi:uncharacterized protein (DUF58 family)